MSSEEEAATSFDSDYKPWGEVETGDRLPYLPERVYHASVGVEGPNRSLTLSVQGNPRIRTEGGRGPIPDERSTDGFAVLSLTGSYDLPRWDASIRATVEKPTDATNVVSRRPAGARPGFPRRLTAEIRVGTW